jgi:acyl-CoA reductase-like NAD-dependent aldehyde dehydrogenase
MELFLTKVQSITRRIGDRKLKEPQQVLNLISLAMNPKSSMGSLISVAQRDRVHAVVLRSSGTILAGGYLMEGKSPLDGFDLSKGSFYPPTVVAGMELQDELWKEEVFGPVVVVQKFRVHFFGYGGFNLLTF